MMDNATHNLEVQWARVETPFARVLAIAGKRVSTEAYYLETRITRSPLLQRSRRAAYSEEGP